jgi:glycosyltransferase involved in cell wall biosynthesis
MACGIPVVTTDSGAIPEYVPADRAGLVVPENDVPALARAMNFLLENPDAARVMGARGREYALAHYDACRNVRRAESLVMEYCLARGI